MSRHVPRSIRESLEEYGRGIAGGLLFSLPMLYTMEVWWRGFTVDPSVLVIYLVVTFVLLLGYNRYSGMRRDARFVEVIIDSVEEMGLGLVIAAGVLFLMGRITREMPFSEILGKIVVEAMTVAIGVSVGTAQLGGGQGDTGARPSSHSDRPTSGEAGNKPVEPPRPNSWEQLVLGFCGAVLIASNIAPTEEIVELGIEIAPTKLVGIVALSLTVCALVLFYSGFVGSDRHVRRGEIVWTGYGIVTTYAVSLVASALMLWFFGQLAGAGLQVIVAETVVLAFPASLGASAGRLLIQ